MVRVLGINLKPPGKLFSPFARPTTPGGKTYLFYALLILGGKRTSFTPTSGKKHPLTKNTPRKVGILLHSPSSFQKRRDFLRRLDPPPKQTPHLPDHTDHLGGGKTCLLYAGLFRGKKWPLRLLEKKKTFTKKHPFFLTKHTHNPQFLFTYAPLKYPRNKFPTFRSILINGGKTCLLYATYTTTRIVCG